MIEFSSTSSFLAPVQMMSAPCVPTASIATELFVSSDDATTASSEDDLARVFLSPTRESFQVLLCGGDDKDEDEDLALTPPVRRSSSRLARAQPPTHSMLSVAPKPRTKRSVATRATAAGTDSFEPQQPKKRPKRKASYLARKEEKAALAKHAVELAQQLVTLRAEAAAHTSAAAQRQTRTQLAKTVLVDAIEKHHLTIARLRAMLSDQLMVRTLNPVETVIRLPTDREARDATLLELKRHKLEEAKRFLTARSDGIDVTKRFTDEERFETPDGDLCTLRFDVVPLRNAPSVQAVFDVMVYYINNIEITISETMGFLTIREDDDSRVDDHVSQNRLVMTVSPSIEIESNSVMFSEFVQENDGNETTGDGDFGIVASTFVEEDELYPYQPHARVRRDISAMMTVSSHMVTRRATKATPATASASNTIEDERELVVVLKRWAMIKMHKTDLPIAADALEDIRDNYSRFPDELAKVLRPTMS